jgi:fermentation-respiration switch protein FrsA (DUF1100 family)
LVIVQNECINSIPLLHVVKQSIKEERLPLVIFNHGFMSVKERNLHYAYMLAQEGFRVILPEAFLHGERGAGIKKSEYYARFWEIVLKTISDVNTIKEHYEEKGLVHSEQIGVAGTSMGGIAALGSLTQYKWIKAAVSLMGMPAYEKFSRWQLEQLKSLGVQLPFTDAEIDQQLIILRQYDLSIQPGKLENRPLLFWHGKKDPQVPYDFAFQFYKKIEPAYKSEPDRLGFITDEKAGHNVSLDGVNAAVQWFKNYLLDEGVDHHE